MGAVERQSRKGSCSWYAFPKRVTVDFSIIIKIMFTKTICKRSIIVIVYEMTFRYHSGGVMLPCIFEN